MPVQQDAELKLWSVEDATEAVQRVRRTLVKEIIEFWKNSQGRQGSLGYSQREREKALEWAHDLWNQGSESPAAVRFRRWYKLDRAIAVLSARSSDLRGEIDLSETPDA